MYAIYAYIGVGTYIWSVWEWNRQSYGSPVVFGPLSLPDLPNLPHVSNVTRSLIRSRRTDHHGSSWSTWRTTLHVLLRRSQLMTKVFGESLEHTRPSRR